MAKSIMTFFQTPQEATMLNYLHYLVIFDTHKLILYDMKIGAMDVITCGIKSITLCS